MPVGEEFGSLENLPSIPDDLEVVIKAWSSLSGEAKGKVLTVILQEHVGLGG